MVRAFRGGIHPRYFRELTRDKPLREAKLPEKVVIPLSQHIGAPAEALVKPGDAVKVGTLIGQSSKFISASVHSSLSGRVTAIENRPHPVLGDAMAVVIEGDGKNEHEIFSSRDPEHVSSEEVKKLIINAGIVGLGGAAFPAHVKLFLPRGKKVDTFILNGAECEPYLTGDYRIMVEKTKEVIGGLRIIKRILNTEKAYVGIEKDKTEAIRVMKEALTNEKNIIVIPLTVKYPQGGEKQLIKTILNREIPGGGLPMDAGCMVSNVGTALSVYEAVTFGRPLYRRVVTVTGTMIKNPVNLLARIGTRIGDLIEECGGVTGNCAKVITGGPMMGPAQYSLDVPVIKGTTGILCLGGKEISLHEELPCIHCARCVDVCPMGLLPTEMRKQIKAGRCEELQNYNLSDCLECGCCEYVCPAHIPLVHLFKLGKSEIQRTGRP